MSQLFQHIPCGSSIPVNNPHAISVSLPTLSDVIGYEENNPALKNKMKSGYPRFFRNKLVDHTVSFIRRKNDIPLDFELLPVSSPHAASMLESEISYKPDILFSENFTVLKIPANSSKISQIKSFLQHTGFIPSSRKAEDFLLNQKQVSEPFLEDSDNSNEAESVIKNVLANAYEKVSASDIILSNSGMTAIYGVFDAIRKARKNKSIVVQLGWLYLDTMEIIKKYSASNYLHFNPTDTETLKNWLSLHHQDVQAIFTEVPSNPLIQCVDLPLISTLAKKYDIPLVVDGTIGTPFNIEVISYADIVVESLTKFACGHGDILMGAILPNPESHHAAACKSQMEQSNETPYIRDIQRMAYNIRDYKERIKICSDNTLSLIKYFETSKTVPQVYSVIHHATKDNFLKIQKHSSNVPALISVVFNKSLGNYYDSLPLCKGPSLGTEFTLAMPYVYLAHYDLVKTEAGRKVLAKNGLSPDLLRISVGTEPVNELIAEFDKCFTYSG